MAYDRWRTDVEMSCLPCAAGGLIIQMKRFERLPGVKVILGDDLFCLREALGRQGVRAEVTHESIDGKLVQFFCWRLCVNHIFAV